VALKQCVKFCREEMARKSTNRCHIPSLPDKDAYRSATARCGFSE
jgi:hypothetical protein